MQKVYFAAQTWRVSVRGHTPYSKYAVFKEHCAGFPLATIASFSFPIPPLYYVRCISKKGAPKRTTHSLHYRCVCFVKIRTVVWIWETKYLAHLPHLDPASIRWIWRKVKNWVTDFLLRLQTNVALSVTWRRQNMACLTPKNRAPHIIENGKPYNVALLHFISYTWPLEILCPIQHMSKCLLLLRA